MNTIRCLFVAVSLSLFAGCGGGGTPKPPAPLPPPTALTLEEWKTLPIEEKYDGATFERLKLADPKLQNDRNWAYYEKQYIIPERKKDIPSHPGNPPQGPK